MFKKILFAFSVLIISFLVYYISWISVFTSSVISDSQDALTNNDISFFLKYSNYYNDTPIYSESNSSVTIDIYEANFDETVFSSDETENSIIENLGNAFYIVIRDFSDSVVLDSSNSSSLSSIVYEENGEEYTVNFSSYSYSTIPVITLYPSYSRLVNELTLEGDSAISSLDKLSIYDAEENIIIEINSDDFLPINNRTLEDWNTDGLPGYSDSELKAMMYPWSKMGPVWRNIAIFLVIATGAGFLFFWPRKPKMIEINNVSDYK